MRESWSAYCVVGRNQLSIVGIAVVRFSFGDCVVAVNPTLDRASHEDFLKIYLEVVDSEKEPPQQLIDRAREELASLGITPEEAIKLVQEEASLDRVR